MAGGTDRGIQRCNVFPALGSNQSGLSILVLMTVAALPCIACTSGQLGFALFQVPQLSFPSLLSWFASITEPSHLSCNKSRCFHQHPLSFGNRARPRIVWPSGSPSFHPPSSINSHDKFHTHFHRYFFFHRSCTNTWLTCTLDLLRHSVLGALLLLHSEISSLFLTAYLFHFSQPYLFMFQHFHETAPHIFLPRPFQFLKVNFDALDQCKLLLRCSTPVHQHNCPCMWPQSHLGCLTPYTAPTSLPA